MVSSTRPTTSSASRFSVVFEGPLVWLPAVPEPDAVTSRCFIEFNACHRPLHGRDVCQIRGNLTQYGSP